MNRARIRKQYIGKSYFWVFSHMLCGVQNVKHNGLHYEAWCASWDEAMCVFDKHRKSHVELGYAR